jgi:hypothetical protein
MAWGSTHVLPHWCQAPNHWSTKLADSLFTTCPCCMLFRGIFITLFSVVLWLALMALVIVSLA